MRNGKIAQTFQDTGIVNEITCPQVFMTAGKALVFPAGFRWYCTPLTIRIRGCRPGCFR